jgi:hypothetical protein
MAKIVGTIELTPQPGFPTLKGKDGDETIVMKYTCAEDELATLPDYGASFTDSRYPFFGSLTGHLLETKEIVRDKSGEFYDITLNYKDPQGGSGNVPSGPVAEEWDYETQDYDVPIEQHSAYRTKWNHKIAVIKGTSVAYPRWSDDTGKAPNEMSQEDSKKYAWLKPDDKIPDGWEFWTGATKPGLESFRSGITTVNWVKRCTNLNKLIALATDDYKIKTPKHTFGRSGKWLRGGSRFKKEGRVWVYTTRYLNASTWDNDIYSA